MNKNELSYFHLERDGITLELKKNFDTDTLKEFLAAMPQSAPAPAMYAPQPQAAAPAAGGGASAPASGASGNEVEITSPMVGTFYRSPSPDEPPFTDVGATVTDDTTVCVVEAMKVFNEIKAETRGTIVKVLVENGSPVQYGEPLFLVKPD